MIYVQQQITEFTDDNIGSLVDAWDVATTYNVGDLARVGSYQYKSTLDSNIGNDPLENLGIYWLQWQPANDYAMLDLLSDTKTEWAGQGYVEFSRGNKDTLGIGNFKATSVTIEYRDDIGTVVDSAVYNFSVNREVWDEWTYGYAPFTDTVSNTVYAPILRKGTVIRVTFDAGAFNTNCGFLVAGQSIDMGQTLDKVSFPDKRIGSKTVSSASFQTIVPKVELMRKMESAKKLVDEPMMFIIDESENSYHQNMVILGKITQCSGTASVNDKNAISWQVEQNIME